MSVSTAEHRPPHYGGEMGRDTTSATPVDSIRRSMEQTDPSLNYIQKRSGLNLCDLFIFLFFGDENNL